jgi:NodT family efflux transporter outer membrane factor (OMF) lipoprotein
MRLRALSFSLLLPATVACAVGPRYKRPELPVPKAWQESPVAEAAANGTTLERWWTAFHDPILDRLVARAVEGNLDLKIAAARIREARAARGIAAAAALPQVGVEGAYSRARRSDAVPPFKSAPGGSSPFGPREQNAFEAGFDAGWEIDVFGGVRRDKEAALAQFEAAEEARRDVLVTLLADVARNYAELRAAQQQLQILEETLRSERDTLGLAKARLDAGLGTELDVARAEGLLAANAAQRPVLERLARQAVYRLGVLLGRHPGALAPELEAPGAIPPAPPEIPPTLPSELLSRRPDLRRAERELAAATPRVGVARADLFPRFSILGSLGRRSEDAGDLSSGISQFWSFLPLVRWPIFSGGRIRANIRVQDARQEQALRLYEKAVLTALEEVENALSALTRERRRQESLRASVAANRRALELAMDRYTSGLESFLSVLDAQRSVYAAEDQLVQSERNAVVALISVYKSLGGGWSFDQPASASQPGAESRRVAAAPSDGAKVR